MYNQELNDEIYDALCNIYTEQFNAEMNVCDALDKLDDKELMMEEYIQEYKRLPTSMVKQNQNKTKNENIGKLRNLKSFVRKKIEKDGFSYELEIPIKDIDSTLAKELCYTIDNIKKYYTKDENKFKIYKNKLLKLIGVHKPIDMVHLNVHCTSYDENSIDVPWTEYNPNDIVLPKKNLMFIHQSDVDNIKELKPSATSKNWNDDHEYGGKAIYFQVLDKRDPDIRKSVNDGYWGKYTYEYIPKPNDIFYIDKNIMYDKDEADERLAAYMTPVFIKTDKPLPVHKINKKIFDVQTKKYAKNPENYKADKYEKKVALKKNFENFLDYAKGRGSLGRDIDDALNLPTTLIPINFLNGYSTTYTRLITIDGYELALSYLKNDQTDMGKNKLKHDRMILNDIGKTIIQNIQKLKSIFIEKNKQYKGYEIYAKKFDDLIRDVISKSKQHGIYLEKYQ